MRQTGLEATEAPDLKNGATEPTKKTEKKLIFFSDSSVFSVAPFLRSVASMYLRRLETQLLRTTDHGPRITSVEDTRYNSPPWSRFDGFSPLS